MRSASATVMLSPPAPPVIAQQPQNATVIVGETATFMVMASGSGLTYEWQSMPPGATDFSHIAGASAIPTFSRLRSRTAAPRFDVW